MAGWHHDGVFKPKACKVCSAIFTPKSGVHSFCSEECKGRWQYISGRVSTETQYKQISGNWRGYLRRLRHLAGGQRIGLSIDQLMLKLEQQSYRCAISGLQMTCTLEKGKRFPYNASIDRIEAGGPYSFGNIQLVCRCLNSWRSDTPLDVFVNICKAIAEFQTKKEREVTDGSQSRLSIAK